MLYPFSIKSLLICSPEFHPRKHTKMNYATQKRLAKKRKNKK